MTLPATATDWDRAPGPPLGLRGLKLPHGVFGGMRPGKSWRIGVYAGVTET